tara:strand:- start:106 stop:573 length:468 start_codon:yes stop_codon:yes gene_type:complete
MSNKWLFFPAPVSAGGETVIDTYNLGGNEWRWRSSNNWWNRLNFGTWTSSGSTTGSHLKIDSGSRISTTGVLFSAGDPDQAGLGADWEVRVTITPSTGGVKRTLRGSNAGAGDSVWNWVDSGGSTVTFSSADMESGGNWGWDQADAVKIELVDPS